MANKTVRGSASLKCSLVVASIIVTGTSALGQEESNRFADSFNRERPNSQARAADFGRQFAQLNPDRSSELSLVAEAVYSTNARLKYAALVASNTASKCDPAAAMLLARLLYDADLAVRAQTLALIENCHLGDARLVGPLSDAATRDPIPGLRGAAYETMATSLKRLTTSPTRGDVSILQALREGIAVELPVVAETAQLTRLRAALADVDAAIESMRRYFLDEETRQRAAVASPPPPSLSDTARESWHRLGMPAQAGLLAIALVLAVHLYYLLLLRAWPHKLFQYSYRAYPHFVFPFLLRPDIHRGRLRPALGFLAALGRSGCAPTHLSYVPWLSLAARRMKSADKRTLCEAIIEAIEASDSSEGKGALFSQLDAIEPSTALRNQDLRPEDPEIEAARDNMSRIMNLPKGTFTRAGVELAHALKQATTISADFYNVITRADDSYAIYMVDVDHHGLPASLDAMRVQFALQAARGWGLGRPAAELEAADTLVRDVTGGQVSVSMNFLEVDVTGRRVRYASAGMPPALLFRRGESEPVRLLAVGSYVGEAYAFDFREPRQTDHPLGPGDIIVVCSDGITEARHPESGRTFGDRKSVV